jgi:hypothetical protein
MTAPIQKNEGDHDEHEISDCLRKAMEAGTLEDCKKCVDEAMKKMAERAARRVGKGGGYCRTQPCGHPDCEKNYAEAKAAAAKPVEEQVVKSKFVVTKDEKGARWELDFAFEKLHDEKRLVGGIVYEPDVEDSQGDWARAEEIEKAAHNFLAESKTLGLMHKEAAGPRAEIVECAIAHDNFLMGKQTIRKGTWFMVVRVKDDSLWDMVKRGEITGFSMGGRARYAQ